MISYPWTIRQAPKVIGTLNLKILGLGFLYPKTANPPKVIYKVLNSKRHKQAKDRGYQARLDGKSITDNYYSRLGKRMQVYASLWERGWNEADQNIEQKLLTK